MQQSPVQAVDRVCVRAERLKGKRRRAFTSTLAVMAFLLLGASAQDAGAVIYGGHESGVQHRPKVHIILWGGPAYWTSDPEGIALRQNLEGLYQSISGSGWQGILTQYYDYSTHPSSTLTLAPTYVSEYSPSMAIDWSSVPLIVRDAITKERAAKAWGPITPDSQYVVVAAKGSGYVTGIFESTCAFHDWDWENPTTESGAQFNYSFLFFYGGAETIPKCRRYSKNPVQTLTTLASHEYAESVTEPIPTGNGLYRRGWYQPESGTGGTISDLCTPEENAGQPGPGGFYVTKLWDNNLGECALSDPSPPVPSPQQPIPVAQADGKINLWWGGIGGAFEYASSSDEGKNWSSVGLAPNPVSRTYPSAGQPSAVEAKPGEVQFFMKSGRDTGGLPTGCTEPFTDNDLVGGAGGVPCYGSPKTPIGPLGGPPKAVAMGGGVVKVFWRGTDNALWYATETGTAWSEPVRVGGVLNSDPSVVKSGSNLHVFWKTLLGGLVHRSYNEATGWSGEEIVALLPSMARYGAPTALARSGGGAEVLWTTASGLQRAWYNGGWTTNAVTGPGSGFGAPNPQFSPAAVSTSGNEAQVWYTGTDGHIWTSTSSAPGAWSQIVLFWPAGDGVGTQPQATIAGNGHASVYWMDPNIERVYAAWNDGAWHPATLVAPREPMAPTATSGFAGNGSSEKTVSATGTVFGGRGKTQYWFEYGKTTAYGSTAGNSSNWESFPKDVKQTLSSGLEPGTTYHYRLVAESELGKSTGKDEAFTTGWSRNPVEGTRIESISCVSSSDCTAVGSAGGVPLVQRWNGTKWSVEVAVAPEAEAQSAELTGVSCLSASSCVAVGDYTSKAGKSLTWAERRTGSTWSLVATQSKSLSSGTRNVLTGVSCRSAAECVAVGYYVDDSEGPTVTKPMGEYLTGSGFILQGLPALGGSNDVRLTGVSCYALEECTAVGFHQAASSEWKPLQAQWFGPSGWTVAALALPAGASDGWLYGISCPAKDYCAAVGMQEVAASEVHAHIPLTEHRNGEKSASWEAKPAPLDTGVEGTLYGVSCTAKENCVATGTYQGNFFGEKVLAESWNGSSWSPQFPINPAERADSGDARLTAVSCVRVGSCSAGGYFQGDLNALADSFLIKVPPTVSTNAASGIGSTSASLNGSVNPNGAVSTYYFEYGLTSSYGMTSASGETGAGESALSVSRGVSGLQQNTTYHFRVVASNGIGPVQYGKDQTFTTERVWSVQPTPSPEGSKLTKLNGVSCSSEVSCTAVGEYKNASSVTEPVAERWPGSSWGLMGMTKGLEATSLNGTHCFPSGECVAVGYYRSGSGVEKAIVERLIGTKWEPQAIPLPAGATASALNGVSCNTLGQCAAVGYYEVSKVRKVLIERWTGTKWELQASPEPAGTESAELNGVSCARWTISGIQFDECIAVGGYTKAGVNEPYAERWTGTQWEPRVATKPGTAKYARFASVSCPSPVSLMLSCEAVGYSGASGVDAALAYKWNGVAWEAQAFPTPGGETPRLTGVFCSSSSNCTAVGTFKGSGVSKSFAARWKESKWELQGLPMPEGAKAFSLGGVACGSGGGCSAVGSYENASGITVPLAERYG